MSTAEKRHFSLYTGIKGRASKPKYFQLFSLMNRDPEVTDKDLKNAGFNAADKNFLKEKIEESQHTLYLGKSVTGKLKWLTESMERYYKKQQWPELAKCIKKTKKIAQHYERYLAKMFLKS